MKNSFILLATLALCGCSLQQRVDKTMARIEQQYAETKAWEDLPLRCISWKQALIMMRERNLELLRQRENISESERNELSVYTQMIPGVTYYTYFNSSLRDLTNRVNSDQATTTVNVDFGLPTLTQIPYRVYAAKATTYGQIKTMEGKERELVAALYRIVRGKEIDDAQKKLDSENAPADAEAPQDINRDNKENSWGEIAKILGNSEARWVILPDSMPHVRWEMYEPRLDKLDPLIVCQFAMQLEQSRMAQYGIALQYVPTVNTNLYSPSLFSSSGGTYTGTFLDSKDTRINLNISYSLDTKMTLWNNFMRSKSRHEQTKHEIAAQLMDYRNKLSKIRKSYAEYVLWRSVMQKRLAFLRASTPGSAEEYLDRHKNITSIKKELLSQEARSIETEAALILQYGLLEQ